MVPADARAIHLLLLYGIAVAICVLAFRDLCIGWAAESRQPQQCDLYGSH
jgi:hypothetical protein